MQGPQINPELIKHLMKPKRESYDHFDKSWSI